MENGNQTNSKDFELIGFIDYEDYNLLLFTVFFTIYILTLIGNLLIIVVVYYNTNLHTPMYFFITNLSCLEILYVSTTTPKLLNMLATNNNKISFCWCLVQMYIFHSLGITECYLLAIMAIDRFVAICKPLRYSVIMSTKVVRNLSLMCWMPGLFSEFILVPLTSQITFGERNLVNHYFCDIVPILSLACSDITVPVTINRFVGGFTTLFNLAIVILMYINIIYSILKTIKTNIGRKKVFSTCSSHLIVVTLIYGTACIVYTPKASHSVEYDKLFALVFAMLTPFLNPIIYSLRNHEVIQGVKRCLQSIKRFIGER
ncbi:hypothetical protein GDO81_014878 [Engystomops pustulosus]|uniref:Olfactory receptor n=1 Tax=Engystomops pustulosus TaxID=76066 RepID=A0AAV7AFU8_ENGPU|nr:hypothetical protein GDO81_014878 [Engystomops pustulosus]